MEWFTVLLLGFFLGMKHATDADHVVAVTTIVSRQRRLIPAALIGMAWGLGHTLTIFLIGSAIIYLQFTISPHLGLSMEFSVGVMIVILGILSIRSMLRHPHNDTEAHTHVQAALSREGTFVTRYFRPLFVGLVHGMAGSAAVALLVLQTISDTRAAFLYLIIFGLGTVAGMMIITLVLGIPFIYSRRMNGLNRFLGYGTAVFSIGFGLMIMYQLGIVDGLFSDHPVWEPE